jgi:hypothetical protein
METITPTLIIVGCINLLMFPVLTWLLKRFIGVRMDSYDAKREAARMEAERSRADSRLWRQAMEDGMKSLLRAELLHEHNKWTARGYCPFDSKQYLEKLHSAYNGVGGNSIGDKLYEETISLPTMKDGE